MIEFIINKTGGGVNAIESEREVAGSLQLQTHSQQRFRETAVQINHQHQSTEDKRGMQVDWSSMITAAAVEKNRRNTPSRQNNERKTWDIRRCYQTSYSLYIHSTGLVLRFFSSVNLTCVSSHSLLFFSLCCVQLVSLTRARTASTANVSAVHRTHLVRVIQLMLASFIWIRLCATRPNVLTVVLSFTSRVKMAKALSTLSARSRMSNREFFIETFFWLRLFFRPAPSTTPSASS